MEGTRHEKVLLIIVAYVIGFTTAFIAFGVGKMHKQTHVLFMHAQSQAMETEKPHTQSTTVAIGEDGLYLITEEKRRLLSADRNALAASATLSAAEPGFYYEIVDAEASRDGRFIYYCEQLTEDAVNCDAYVYVIADDTTYRVSKDGNIFYPVIESHESLWTEESVLMVNGAVSVDPDRPWELVSVGEPIVQ